MPILNRPELFSLDTAGDQVLVELCRTARDIREQYWGSTVTYSRKIFIPLTNMCRDQCGYCTFVEHPDSPSAHIMAPEEVMRSLENGRALACKEALFSLGEKPESRYPKAAAMLARLGYDRMVDYLRDICEMTLQETDLIPHVNAGTLNEKDIEQLKPVSGSMGMMLESLSIDLLRKGGPHYRCPDKAPKRRLETMRRAGKHSVPFTTGLLIGIGESWCERVETLLAINDCHREYGHIQEVIIQNFKAKPGTAMACFPEPDLRQMMLTLAVARIILDPSISLQAPPNLQPRHLNYLDAGINDWGGISPVTCDYINPEQAWPDLESLNRQTAEKGLTLQERLTVYPGFLRRERFTDNRIAEKLHAVARADGLALAQVF